MIIADKVGIGGNGFVYGEPVYILSGNLGDFSVILGKVSLEDTITKYSNRRLLKATEANKRMLETLFGVRVPNPPLEGKELAKKLLKRNKYLLCKVKNSGKYESKLKIIEGFVEDRDVFVDVDGFEWWEAVAVGTDGKDIKDSGMDFATMEKAYLKGVGLEL